MKLNLGCGNKSYEGFINVDKYPTSTSHVVFDLETTPWPWEDNSVEEIRLIHALEHIGRDSDTYLGIIKELYRICKNGAAVVIHVPHPRHDNFLGDPTHVRAITPQSLTLFDRQKCDEWVAGGISAATPLAHYLNVDFYIAELVTVLDPVHHAELTSGAITMEELNRRARDLNNVIAEYHIKLVARKPGA